MQNQNCIFELVDNHIFCLKSYKLYRDSIPNVFKEFNKGKTSWFMGLSIVRICAK